MNNLENNYNEYRDIADGFVKNLKKKEGVIGIAYLGGLGKRKIADKFSDIDISVFVNKNEDMQWLPRFEFSVLNVNGKAYAFNVHQQDYSKQELLEWNPEKIEAYKNADVVYDSDNKLQDLIIRKVGKYNESKHELLRELVSKIPPYTKINPMKQYERGYNLTAHALLNKGIDYIVDTLYVLNQEPIPHDKWKIAKIGELKYTPTNIIEKLEKTLLVTKEDILNPVKRIQIVATLGTEVLDLTEKELGKDSLESYLEACHKDLDRQLNAYSYSDTVISKLGHLNQTEIETLRGFLSYNLVANKEDLLNLIKNKDTIFKLKGRELCSSIIKYL